MRPRTPSWANVISTVREMSRRCSREMRPTTSEPNASPYVKDGINEYVVHGNHNAVNPAKTGTKSAAHYQLNVGAGKTATVRLQLSGLAPAAIGDPFKNFDEIMQTGRHEADEFYKSITPGHVSSDEALVMRRALAGCGFRQGATRPDAAGILPASDRSNFGLRVELQRRQSGPYTHGPPFSCTARNRRCTAKAKRHFHGILPLMTNGVWPKASRNFLEAFFFRLRTSPGRSRRPGRN